MKTFISALLVFCVWACHMSFGQSVAIDSRAFFDDTSALSATIVTNLSKILNNHKKNGYDFPGTFQTTLPDGIMVNDQILLEARGNFRLSFCYLPPIRIIFNYKDASILHSLKTLKLVNDCKISQDYDQYVLKEFIIYKIYNLLTDISFRVRLLNLNWQDSAGKKKTITEHAFLLEDIKDVAKRNNYKVWKIVRLRPDGADRQQMTMVAIFEYMIGNTDWSASVDHNTKLLVPLKDSFARPFVVPYDFDYSGFVNTNYAVPNERLNIENVRQRLYRGYPRTMLELTEVLNIYKQQKSKIYALINNFDLLTSYSKGEIIDYINDFYNIINDPDQVRLNFIENARTQ